MQLLCLADDRVVDGFGDFLPADHPQRVRVEPVNARVLRSPYRPPGFGALLFEDVLIFEVGGEPCRGLRGHHFPRGFGSLKNFAERLREAWRNSLLHHQVSPVLDQLHFQLRLDTS